MPRIKRATPARHARALTCHDGLWGTGAWLGFRGLSLRRFPGKGGCGVGSAQKSSVWCTAGSAARMLAGKYKSGIPLTRPVPGQHTRKLVDGQKVCRVTVSMFHQLAVHTAALIAISHLCTQWHRAMRRGQTFPKPLLTQSLEASQRSTQGPEKRHPLRPVCTVSAGRRRSWLASGIFAGSEHSIHAIGIPDLRDALSKLSQTRRSATRTDFDVLQRRRLAMHHGNGGENKNRKEDRRDERVRARHWLLGAEHGPEHHGTELFYLLDVAENTSHRAGCFRQSTVAAVPRVVMSEDGFLEAGWVPAKAGRRNELPGRFVSLARRCVLSLSMGTSTSNMAAKSVVGCSKPCSKFDQGMCGLRAPTKEGWVSRSAR